MLHAQQKKNALWNCKEHKQTVTGMVVNTQFYLVYIYGMVKHIKFNGERVETSKKKDQPEKPWRITLS